MTPETDLSAYVVKLLDEHILAMQRLRTLMRMRATTRPGARYLLALDSIRAAQEFTGRLMAAVLPAATTPRPRRPPTDAARPTTAGAR